MHVQMTHAIWAVALPAAAAGLLGCDAPVTQGTVAPAQAEVEPVQSDPTAGEAALQAQPESGPNAESAVPVELPTWTQLNVDALRYVAYPDGPFNSYADDPGPRLTTIAYPEGQRVEEWTENHEEQGIIRLSPSDARLLGLPKPPKHVYLLGPNGPCESKTKLPYALVTTDLSIVLETGFLLEACTGDYGPVAYLGEQPPASLSWHKAKTIESEYIDPQTLKHPARDHLLAMGLLEDTDEELGKANTSEIRIREAGPVREFGVAHHWPGDDCEESQHIGLATSLWAKDAKPSWIESRSQWEGPELEGALTIDGHLAGIVFDERYQMLLRSQDGTQAVWTDFITGDYHDEDTAYWGWSVLEGYCGP